MKPALSLLLTASLTTSLAGTALAGPEGSDDITVIHAGSLIDTEAGQMVRDRYIVIAEGRVDKVVGRAEFERMDSPDRFVDLSEMTVLPGLTDAHVHLIGQAANYGYNSLAESTPRAAIIGVANAKVTLDAGFTTVRNVGAPGYADIDLRDVIADGLVPGPRIIPAGPSIGITGGHCDSNLLPFEYEQTSDGVADGPWGVRKKVRQNKKYGAEVIKFCGTGGVLSKGTTIGAQQFTAEEMEAIVDEAHQLGMKVTVHAHGENGIRTAIAAGVDSVEHASLITDDAIQMAVQRGTALSMDIFVSDFILSEGEAAGILPESLEKERQVGRKQRERFQAAVEAGATMAFGTDAGVYPHGRNGQQFAYMVEWGLTPIQAIQSATTVNAKLFGLEGQIGVIKKGAEADIIAVDGNPLQDISELEDVDFVMKSGRIHLTQND
ncbi:amidohydrolase family protein [Algimonas porphyrae]|uniref:Xaa-Pro dipeptidase n=1 Tax=Algimonas porphyrae TaxID=1128113 RepID=A0ABQ5UWW4_9PROT|nr:amidohydrolase family protein [Algimonas porphyrae]GLQ19362.1 Xaa-Pro dipeptidase [Algimonas porphyrae]